MCISYSMPSHVSFLIVLCSSLSYPHEDDDVLLVIRCPPDSLQQDQFIVEEEHELNSSFKLGENEELVSRLVHIRPSGEGPLQCEVSYNVF